MNPIDISKFEQLKASGELPSPKGVALAILRLTQREGVSLPEVETVARNDPAFVGRLIKAANSAFGGGRRPVVAVMDALVTLGIATVRAMALGFSLIGQYRAGPCSAFDYRRFWGASLATALAMQGIAERGRFGRQEEMFALGLLSRVGELAMATLFSAEYASVITAWNNGTRAQLIAAERQAFSLDHVELSVGMLSDWGLPRAMVDAVLLAGSPEMAGLVENERSQTMARALNVAGRFASVCLDEPVRRQRACLELVAEAKAFNIDADDVAALCDQTALRWREWGALLEVDTHAVPAFKTLLQEAESAAQAGSPAVERPVAVVVDDDPATRETLRLILESLGHQVFDAADGRKGIELAMDVQPGLMVADWVMPEMDGLEMTRELRKTRLGRGIYIILLTGCETGEDALVRAFDSGVDDFLVKPVSCKVLQARLRAGQRIVRMQRDMEKDREEIRHFAAELAISNRRLAEVALTDALTGFPNRRYAMDRIAQEWAATTRSQRPLACMVIDVDAFKGINDTHGHDVGDQVLRQTAAALKRGLRAQDVVCRTGGDEFLVICPDTTLEAALACGERVRQAVEAIQVRTGMIQLRSTVSIGVAVRDAGMTDADALIKRADQGLYLAKQRGRNQVAVA